MLYNETILETLSLIEEDLTVPRNVRTKIKAVISLVVEKNGVSAEVKRDQILQHLEDLSSDSNIPAFTRTQIFHVVSNLESRQ